MNFNTAKAHFWLLVSQYFRKYFRNYFQTYFRNYFRNYFQKSFQIYSLFFECQLRRARQASCAFPFLAGAWRIQRSFFFSSNTAKHFLAPNKVSLHVSGIVSGIISEIIS